MSSRSESGVKCHRSESFSELFSYKISLKISFQCENLRQHVELLNEELGNKDEFIKELQQQLQMCEDDLVSDVFSALLWKK